MRPTQVVINAEALTHNFNRVKRLAPQSRIISMIKANAYGHGLVDTAKHLTDSDAFGVASIDEALWLREQSITTPIVLMEGFFQASELPLIAQHQLQCVLHSEWQVRALLAWRSPSPIVVWLKCDSGMRRLGFDQQQLQTVWQQCQACSHIAKPIGLMTHFACANEEVLAINQQQQNYFAQTCENLPGPYCLANSAAILSLPCSHADWVRPGLMLFGVSPFATRSAASLGLRPVMTLRSQIIAIKQCQVGDSIGYGATFTCEQVMTIGIVAVGYGDGYPYNATTGTPVYWQGLRLPLLGRVSMDMLAIDLSSAPGAEIGDAIELWGEHVPVSLVARHANNSPYALLCNVNKRVRYVWEHT